MIGHHRTTRSPIGLDVGSRYVKAAQVSGSPEQPVLAAAVSIERPDPDAPWSLAEAERLHGVLDRRGFEGREVVTAVPTEQCLTGVLSLPPARSGAPLGDIAATEMAHMHRCEPRDIQIALWDLPAPARPGDGNPVMAAGCRHDQAEALLTTLEDAGLDVCALDIEGWALVRACRSRLVDQSGTTAIVDLGWSSANMALVHGTTLIYKRMLGAAGLAQLAQSVQRDHRFELSVIDHVLANVGLDDAALAAEADAHLAGKMRGPLESHVEHIAQELSLSLSYAAHQYPDAPVQQLLLVGGGARMPGLDAALTAHLEIETLAVTPSLTCQAQAGLAEQAQAPELDVALGLALYREQEVAA